MSHAQSTNAKYNKDYPKAKDYGKYSLLLTTTNIVFTLLVAMLIVGLTVGLVGRCSYYYPYSGRLICAYLYSYCHLAQND